MEPETVEQSRQRRFAAADRLRPLGFRPLGRMLFDKGGTVYDLSAADLDQIDRIEREKLFVVPAEDVHSILTEMAARYARATGEPTR